MGRQDSTRGKLTRSRFPRWTIVAAGLAAMVGGSAAPAQWRPQKTSEKQKADQKAAKPAAAEDQPNVVFKTDVRLVRMLVTVKDLHGKLIADLTRDDFRVFDNGAEQEVAVFDRQTEQPLSIAVLVDTSGSTAKDLRYEVESVKKFLHAVVGAGNPEDTASLYSFNWRVTLETNYTRRIPRLEQGLRQLHAEGGTSMYDAMLLAAHDMENRRGRHVMVVVTDGGDTTSATNYHKAIEATQLADAVVYPILVMPITNDAGRNIGGENALQSIAISTGGRVFAPTVGATLDQAFAEILRDLRTQYLVGFYPRNAPLTKNRFHSLKIELKRPDLRAQTRTGYYGDAEEGSPSRQ
ncbi:MAG: VWA domain-containing protein [Bryobacteraceae bacterium]